ncbi:hypothetical protein ABGB09_33445 [Streptomyces sp. B8F3]|uniref:hypothetical protein n=1 Tax=Streptomyces sp. B8F3 TaxID=3153573 RepID=UPI00325F28D4
MAGPGHAPDPAAERSQLYGESVSAWIASADPPMSGSELAWAQEQARTAQTDAAHLTDQS